MGERLEDLDFGPYEVDPDSVRLLPQVFCLTHDVLLLDHVDPDTDKPVVVGLSNPSDLNTIDAISRVLRGRRVLPVKIAGDKIQKALALAYGLDKITAKDEVRGDPPQELAGEVMLGEVPDDSRRRKEKIEAVTNEWDVDAPIKRLVNDLLVNALRRGATDIHIENFRYHAATRIKIDGLLQQVNAGITKDNVNEVIIRLKVMSRLDIAERRAPQDGRILLTVEQGGKQQDVAFRLSLIPGLDGEDAVLRVLDKSMAPIDLELLGFTSRDLETFKRLISNPHGMVLNSGPTGSGKTTTLYASLKHINNPTIKILSAEDPVEYDLEGVCQKQISGKLGFADLARAFLRHDPDVLLIGEIRDVETADVATKASQTGHLVLSTVHTNDAVHAVPRLVSLGLTHEEIAQVLLGVLSQRLVRRVCRGCGEPYLPDRKLREPFGEAIKGFEFMRGTGCRRCSNTGFRGRIGLFELLVIDPDLQLAIQNERPVNELNDLAVAHGMRPLVWDGLLKVEHKITTIEELHRVIPLRQIIANTQYARPADNE
ncbi:MAG TPA: GspE/PulE family protein [bacterium]|nr:GspE/PulE family protein [bacterium]